MWECFVRSVEPAHLGPLLSHIIVALLPLIPLQPKETTAIIRFLILDNRYESDKNYFLKCLIGAQEINNSNVIIYFPTGKKSKTTFMRFTFCQTTLS